MSERPRHGFPRLADVVYDIGLVLAALLGTAFVVAMAIGGS